MTDIIADKWQVKENGGSGSGWGDLTGTNDTWSYACFADVTPMVKGFIDADEVDSNGAGEYTLGHAVVEPRAGHPGYSFTLYDTADSTGYPLGTPARKYSSWWYPASRYKYAYAGWSLVIIYTSPETKGHQLYIYGVQTDDFAFVNGQASGGEELTIPVSGFLAPDDTSGSHLTCFVGEGDEMYGCNHPGSNDNDWIKVNDVPLDDGIYDACNVWNSYSNALDDPTVNGIDIDTFDMSSCIDAGDTSAEVKVGSTYDIYNVVYIILSFRSEITTGGTISYLIR
jgi:hypothetical protein